MSDAAKKYGKSLEAYRKTDIMTANRETILLMMYAGAIRFMKAAIEASDKKNIEEKCRMIGKVQGIVTELRSTLNFEAGGELAHTLENLYGFISQRLILATSSETTEPLKEALGIITTLNEGWEAAIETLRKERGKTE